MSLSPALHADRILPGVLLMVAFCVVAPLIDVSAKLASASLSVGQITTARFLVQAALMAPIVWALGHSFRMRPRVLGLTLARAFFLILSSYTFVSAVSVMPVADALAIAFVEPFLLLLLGWAFFGEAVGPRRILASAVGFGGALLVIRPSLTIFGPVALFPLGTALSFALYMIVTRVLSREMHPVPMQFQTALLGFLVCLPVLILASGSGIAGLETRWPEGVFWWFLAGVGVASTISHMAITYALKFAPSATLAPLHYLEIVSAVFFGFLIFEDFPAPLTWAGIAVIAASGLYVIHRERQLARQIQVPLN